MGSRSDDNSEVEFNLLLPDEKIETLSQQVFSLIQQKLAHQSNLRNVFFCRKSPINYTEQFAKLLDQMTEEELSNFTSEFKNFLNKTCTTKYSIINYILSILGNCGALSGGVALTAVGAKEGNPYKLATGIAFTALLPFITQFAVKAGAVVDLKEDIQALLFFSNKLRKNPIIRYKNADYKDSYSIYQQFNSLDLFCIQMALENDNPSAQSTTSRYHVSRIS